ncbi:tetratricopeptide repeat protein [Jannaschia ovalis]|uniref:Tetratricopeptide repeat protein n=1 Tax=Jannaschia ovalis TaxID=3038773 RepID=A0ABY8LC17_9RHOB|nr:tetratricopeptide repeat protein [Jannaschia sp. GRR-S6-38]WGH78862.1 tetratricopeptide repeat protein [Jannaschia sp. GRR-S6-38]
MKIVSLAALATLLPLAAFAAGSEPATQTQTSADCTGAQVWDADKGACVDPQSSSLDDATRIEAARELASFGRPEDALRVLAALDAPETTDALTVRGFATRKAGDLPRAMVFYEAALSLDPQNFLARSYMGQGLAEAGRIDAARLQLAMIREAGGRGTYPERMLARTVETGRAAY